MSISGINQLVKGIIGVLESSSSNHTRLSLIDFKDDLICGGSVGEAGQLHPTQLPIPVGLNIPRLLILEAPCLPHQIPWNMRCLEMHRLASTPPIWAFPFAFSCLAIGQALSSTSVKIIIFWLACFSAVILPVTSSLVFFVVFAYLYPAFYTLL